MRVCAVVLLALTLLPMAAMAESVAPSTRLVDVNPAAFPVPAIPATAAMHSPRVVLCTALMDDDLFHSVGAAVVDGSEITLAFLSPEGSLTLRGEAAMVAPAGWRDNALSRVSDAMGAVTEVLGDHARRMNVPLPSENEAPPENLADQVRRLLMDGLAIGWRFRECTIDLPYDLAREVIKSQVPEAYAPMVDAIVDGIRLFHTGSRAREALDARPELKQSVYEQIVSGVEAGRDVATVQRSVLRTLGIR